MKILIVAPQPFFSFRGTPIATKLLIQELIKLGHKVDILTFHLGEDLNIKDLRTIRIWKLKFIRNIPIGFSIGKLVCDVFLTIKLFYIVTKNNYDVIHAIEESIFPAILISKIFKIPVIYDMDSLLYIPKDSNSFLYKVHKNLAKFFLKKIIRIPVKVVVSNNHLKNYIKVNISSQARIVVLRDSPIRAIEAKENLRKKFNLYDKYLFLYIGNLTSYQGIGLAIEAFSKVKTDKYKFIVIGGDKKQILKYKKLAIKHKVFDKIIFLGVRPIEYMLYYLIQADALILPKLTGNLTPMKANYYKLSRVPILATDIPGNTEILEGSNTYFFKPNVDSFTYVIEKFMKSQNDLSDKENDLFSIKKDAKKFQIRYNLLIKQLYML